MDKVNEEKNATGSLKLIKKTERVSIPELEVIKVKKSSKLGTFIGGAIIIIAGLVSGYFLSHSQLVPSNKSGMVDTNKVVGSTNTKIFKDSAEGVLEKGGIDGEGTHKLVRPGGDSQTVYLTSSVVDLNKFIGKKVKVWGETFAAQKAGWFMDVGRVEITQ